MTEGIGVNRRVWIQAKTSGKYPYCAPATQYRAAEKRQAFPLPNALMEIRTGRARMTEPKATSPHVYQKYDLFSYTKFA